MVDNFLEEAKYEAKERYENGVKLKTDAVKRSTLTAHMQRHMRISTKMAPSNTCAQSVASCQ